MKKIITVLLALVLSISLCACNFVNTRKSSQIFSDTDNTENDSQATSDSESASIKEISINNFTIVDDFECQIKEVNWYSASDFDFDVIQQESGFEYIVIVLSERNTTNQTENAPMLNLLSADGKECSRKAGLSLYKNQYKINFGATMAGSTSESYVIYQIPAGAQSFKLQILSNGLGPGSDYIVFYRNDIQ